MLYRFAKVICSLILIVLRRWDVRGRENFPMHQGVLLTSNHISYWDPVVVGCAIPREIHFMAKAELFAIPVLGPLINKLNAFPVRRGGADRNAIKTALNRLAQGHVLGIFPEGTRSANGELMEPHMGAAMLALKAGVPVLPVAVNGTKGYWGKITVIIGKPMYFEEYREKKAGREDLIKVSKAVMTEIAVLLDSIKR